MDVIYTDVDRVEQGALHQYDIDFDTTGNKDFQISVGIENNVLNGGCLWYIEGTEYGGKVDKLKIITESNEIQYTGRNARGLLQSKVIEPPSGSDYLILSGTLQEVITELISKTEYGDLFVVDESAIEVSNYKVDRYIYLYDGIVKLMATYGRIPTFTFRDGKIHIGVYESVDYSDANEYTQDDLQFTITKSYSNVNHLICLGQGELKDRTVIHLYTDEAGNVSTKQTFLGEHEVVEVYENTNCESYDELMKEGIAKLQELRNTDSFEVTVPDVELKIGDIIGGLETNTNTYVAREIVNIIAKINDYKVELEYKVGEDDAARKSSSSGGSSSSSSVAQNAFSNVKVGDTTIAADTTTDTLTIAAGSNVKITPDATNNKVTIAATSGVVDITQADYNNLANKQDDVLYNIIDADEYIKAENVEYGDSDVKTALDNCLQLSGGTMTGVINGNEGGGLYPDGNLYLNCHGYKDFLSNILTNIYDKLTWKILGNFPIQTIVNLPSGWTELSIAIYCNGYWHKIHICETEVLSNENIQMLVGSYFADNNAYGCHVLVSKTAIYLANATYNYELKTDSFMKVMYR